MIAGVRASAAGGTIQAGQVRRHGSGGDVVPPALPDLHTPDRLAWLEAIQSDEARRSMWIIPALLAVVACWLALLTWWAA